MENKRKYDKLEQITQQVEKSRCFSADAVEIMRKYSQDNDSLIRFEVAKLLINFTDKEEEKILWALTNDKDSLVRAEACDSLSVSCSTETYEILKKKVQTDSNGMVRGYAINSLGEISIRLKLNKDTIGFLTGVLWKENTVFAKVNLFKVLYTHGKEEYLNQLINALNTKRYQNRCSVVHCLEEIVEDKNIHLIVEALLKRKEKEKSFAVISTIDNALSLISRL